MDIIFYLFLVILGYSIGTLHSTYRFLNIMQNAAKGMGIDIEDEIEKRKKSKVNVSKLTVDQHGDILYLYDGENDDFICQGKSLEELAEMAKKYKNIDHAVVEYDKKMFLFNEGKPVEVV